MPSIQSVGKCFSSASDFLQYLDGLRFGSWRPKFITAHHTGLPTLKNWNDWQTRNAPVSDEQWLRNLAHYYGNTLGWSAGPHFFFTPKHYCVLSDPTKRGVHAVSFNAVSWGVEMVGNFDTEEMTPATWYIDGLACLHIALGQSPKPFQRGAFGLHFHRDDPKTSKTCPGKKIIKADLINLIDDAMASMTGVEAPAEIMAAQSYNVPARTGVTNTPGDTLNVRIEPSGKSPIIGALEHGSEVLIHGYVWNGSTLWHRIKTDGRDSYIAGKFVKGL